MKASSMFVCVLLLSGCSLFTRTVYVDVPVPVPCVDKANIPAPVANASDKLRIDDTAGAKIKAVLIEREELRKTDTTFRAIVKGCVSG